MTIPQLPPEAEQEYYKKISKIESNDNPKAKAKTSSASGRFQFIRATWEGLGYDWKDVFNDKKQWEAIERFTKRNAAALVEAGCAVNHATLYGAHFLGVSGFLRVMRGDPSASIATVTNEAQRRANPTILKGTIRDFTDWLKRKTGDDYTKRYTKSGWVSGPGVELPPEAPIVVEPGFGDKPTPEPQRRISGLIVAMLILAGLAAILYFTTR